MNDSEDNDDMEIIGTYAGGEAAHEHALVVLAMRLACRVDASPEGGWRLLVDPASAAAAMDEIRLYEAECSVSKPQEDFLEEEKPAGAFPMVAWTMALVVSYTAQGELPDYTDRFLNSSIGLVARGEWWRPFTALFLHADGGHILSNIGGSWLFFPLLARRTGALWALALALLAGALGNAVVALLSYPENFRSLGASSAVFGSLGALAALASADLARHRQSPDLRKLALPLVAGIAVLGLFGGGESPQVDVAGHVCGFAAGVLSGILWHAVTRTGSFA